MGAKTIAVAHYCEQIFRATALKIVPRLAKTLSPNELTLKLTSQSMHLVELHRGFFSEHLGTIACAEHDGWHILTPCDADVTRNASVADVAEVCPVLRAGLGLAEKYLQEFIELMDLILNRAATTQLLTDVFDRQQLHDIGPVTVRQPDGSSRSKTVYQFERKHTLVRAHMFYVGAKRVVLIVQVLRKDPKNDRRLPGQKQRSADVLERYLAAEAAGTLALLTPQGGRNAFVRITR